MTRPTSFGTLNYERTSSSVSQPQRTLVKSQNTWQNNGECSVAFYLWYVTFPVLVSKCWLYYALRVWENIFMMQRLLTGQCPLPWSRYTSQHSTPLPRPRHSSRHPFLVLGALLSIYPLGTFALVLGFLMMLKLYHCLWQSRIKSFCFVGYTVLIISQNMVASPCLTRFKIGFLNKLLFCFLTPATIPLVKWGGTLVINHHSEDRIC